MNRALITALTAIGAAQVLKVPMQYRASGQWNWGKSIGSGGMPSSHSSGVTALATYIGIRHGLKSPAFALASMLGTIVMYDAMNLRRHTGEIAIQVNDLDAHVETLTGHDSELYHDRRKERLEESIGHQPEEVLAGALLGAAIGCAGALTAP
ncbi:divergent PAP2 family protein [Paenibacillus tarimensis]|uniref:divergent PAP2 family protein n=1 Tax=Paenibacillus tarimensis TaxID=416012 RepID=UPI001F34ADE0|nr:divergent PAP2 family protein [Paenibacillus tarimensis]MCF2944271.1 divergent PAP2 family protein [Paenibacillus tarimensis]